MNIVDICHYYTHPPMSGGQIRINKLNSELSKHHRIEQFSFTPALRKKEAIAITKKYTEHVIPVFPYLIAAAILDRVFRMPFDFAVPSAINLFDIPKELKNSLDHCDLIFIEHPWLFGCISSYLKRENLDKKICVIAHNVEYDLQKAGLKRFPAVFRDIICRRISKIESDALRNCGLIVCVTDNDRERISSLYGVNKNKIHVIENGADIKHFKSKFPRSTLRARLGYRFDDKIILFAGSKHPPNIEAADIIVKKIAPSLDSYKFIIAGSVSKKRVEGNVNFTGMINDIKDYYAISDIAISPIISGSGSNIKIFEYLASSLPIIATKKGSANVKSDSIIISDVENFANSIQNLFKNAKLLHKLRKNGVDIAYKYDWRDRAAKMMELIEIQSK